jgi:hypothetical protein
MKIKVLIVTLFAGMLAASSAYAWSFNYNTYILRHGGTA